MTHRPRVQLSLPTAILWLTAGLVFAAAPTLNRDYGLWAQAEFIPSPPGRLADHNVPEARLVVANASVQAGSSGTGPQRDYPWWPWILAFPALGGGLWWFLRGTAPPLTAGRPKPPSPQSIETTEPTGSGPLNTRVATAGQTAAVLDAPEAALEAESALETDLELAAESTVAHPRRIILTPRSSQSAYVYWELPPSEVEALKRSNYGLSLKLHDVTDIAQVEHQPPHATQRWDCATEAMGDCHVSIAQADREYLVELGYGDEASTWHALVRSAPVRVPPLADLEKPASTSAVTPPSDQIAVPAPSATLPLEAELTPPEQGADGDPVAEDTHSINSVAPAAIPRTSRATARASLSAETCHSAYATWELPPDQVSDLRTGQRRLMVRLYDVTELPGSFALGPNSVQEFEADLAPQASLTLPIAVDDRDYLIEVGYLTGNGQWQILAKSSPVRVPAC